MQICLTQANNLSRRPSPGDVEKLRVLLDADADLIHARDADGSTALHCATWKGHQAIVTFLLSAGADVNIHSNNEHWGTTAHANQATIAQMLVENGAEVNAQDKDGKTPLHHTTFHKAKAAAKVLQNNGAS